MLEEWRPPNDSFFTPREIRRVEEEPEPELKSADDDDFADFFVA